jgi:plastocyanin
VPAYKCKFIYFALALLLVLPLMGHAGTIKGKVVTKARKRIPRRVAQRYPGKHKQPPGQLEPIPAVVLIEGAVKGYPAPKPSQPLTIVQKDFKFQPPLLVVPVNSTVEFPNRDLEFHNVFSYSRTKRFDLGRYHQGESKSVQFDNPGIGKIYCEIHEWMRAAVVVVENPFYTVADKEGNYEIKNIPAGTYRLLVWKMDHKKAGREVKIPAKGILELNFALPETKPKRPGRK